MVGVIHDIRMAGVNLGKHRLCRYEHHRAVAGHIGNDVFPADVIDVFLDVDLELNARRRPLCFGGVDIKHAVVILQWEFGIYRHQPSGFREFQDAVGACAAWKRVLHFVSRFRQYIGNQRGELHFAECTARTLVAQQFLQAHNIGGQGLNFLLRIVDGLQPRHDVDEGLVGLLEAFVEALVDLAADLTRARIDSLGKSLNGGRYLARDRFKIGLQMGLVRPALFSQFFQYRARQAAFEAVQAVTGLGKLQSYRTAKALARFGLSRRYAVTLIREPFVQTGENLAITRLLSGSDILRNAPLDAEQKIDGCRSKDDCDSQAEKQDNLRFHRCSLANGEASRY